MRIVVATCHVDHFQTLRLLFWLKFLGNTGLPLTLTFSRRAWALTNVQRLVAYARKEFSNIEVLQLGDEDERGWPHSASFMLDRSLRLVRGVAFWLEPDCVPLHSNWWADLSEAYVDAGSPPLMGRVVQPNHPTRRRMTGIGFYRADWEQVLGSVYPTKPSGAWNIDLAAKMLPNLVDTPLIQHDWRRWSGNGAVGLDRIEPGVAVFHQCKTGQLMRDLRPEFKDWCLTDPGVREYFQSMANYFVTSNATKPYTVAGQTISFEQTHYNPATNSWWGVYHAESDEQGAALQDLVDQNRIHVITKEDYDKLIEKKKSASQKLSGLSPSRKQAPLPPTPSRVVEDVAAVVVNETVKPVVSPVSTESETLDEALTPVKVPEYRELPTPSRGKRGRPKLQPVESLEE